MIRQRRFLLVVLCAILVAAPVGADVVTLVTSKDNTLYENASGGVSNGAGEFFFVGRTRQLSNFRRRGLIAFEVAGNIPAGSTINSAQLTLHLSRRSIFGAVAQTVELHILLADWGEGTSNALGNEGIGTTATTSDATWIHRFWSTDLWTSAGADGDFSATVSASTLVDLINFYTWGSTAQLVTDVQTWLDDPSSNFGWILIGNEAVQKTARRFDTRENPTTVNRPMLTIDFTPPLEIGACCDDLIGVCTDDVELGDCIAANGRFGGDASDCATLDPPCLPTGACCDDATGICTDLVLEADCQGGELRFGGDGSTCETIDPACVPPPAIGACCDELTGVCTNSVEELVCLESGRRFGGDGSDCTTIAPPCLPSGACCDDSTGSCADGTLEAECLGGGFRYGGDASTCATIDPACLPPPVGACCLQRTGTCLDDLTEAQCTAERGRYGGDESICLTIDPPCEPDIAISLELVAGAAGAVLSGGGPALVAPVYLTHAGDGSGRLFIVDQIGLIRIVDSDGNLLPDPFLNLTDKIVDIDAFFDERGVLGLAFHPDYANNGRFFVRYSAP